MKLIFLYDSEGVFFVSQGNFLLEIASGLEENSLNKTGCEKVNSGHYQCCLLPLHRKREPDEGIQSIILNKFCTHMVQSCIEACWRPLGNS